ncbi:hypothetical protein Tco_1259991 [Tanacetum coccineum]
MIVSWIYVLLRRRAFVLDPFETSSGTVGQDLNLSTERLTSNKAFTNKLWNASKFVLQNLPDRSDASAWETLLAHKLDLLVTEAEIRSLEKREHERMKREFFEITMENGGDHGVDQCEVNDCV